MKRLKRRRDWDWVAKVIEAKGIWKKKEELVWVFSNFLIQNNAKPYNQSSGANQISNHSKQRQEPLFKGPKAEILFPIR
ncbi:MAG: hypothetical protein JNJ58_09205 [Chitinophagaceae bacterium]|nr:hypothetical protein [Chitinophagaceae bacterium]